MKYIIMCGGKYENWQTPRHLLSYKGEPIVSRTIRLLRETGINDIAISSNSKVFERMGVPLLKHNNRYVTRAYNDSDGYWCDAFYPMEDPACYIFGDVVFSPEAIKTIVEYETDDIMLFGSKPPFSSEYPKPYIEPFAFKVANQKHLREAIEKCKSLPQSAFAREPIAWELWYIITGSPTYQEPWKAMQGRARDYVAINDYTCDIDDPKETKKILI